MFLSPLLIISFNKIKIKNRKSMSRKNDNTMNPFFPTDVTTEIFARLPAKSAVKYRILSKQWCSILRSTDFADLFLTQSSTRPRLLFAVERNGVWSFFSSPQPPYATSSSSPSPVIYVDSHFKFSGDVSRFLCSYASGLVFFPDMWIPKEGDYSNPVICNPITGKYVSLPYVSVFRKSRGFVGFDPIDKEFKILTEDHPFCSQRVHHQVLSVGGTGDLSWREKKTDCPYYERCLSEGICIDGVLYYLAENVGDLPRVVVCFDVRSEEFKFIEADCFSDQDTVKLINYKSKIAGVDWKYVKAEGKIVLELSLWVLQDVEKKEWLKSVHIFSEEKIVHRCNFSVVGMTGAGEIVLAMDYTSKPYYVFFFDPEKNTLRNVEIEGFGASLEALGSRGRVRVFVDYVEDLNVHDAKQLKSTISAT